VGRCINHPDRETGYKCMKHSHFQCEECLECRDPELYCKHRSACAIWFMSRGSENLGDEENPKEPGDAVDSGDGYRFAGQDG